MATVAESFALAARYYAAGDVILAEQFSLSVLNENPHHGEALHMLGVIAWQKRDLNTALDYLQRSVSSNGSNATAWKHLGDVHLIARNANAAVANYEQALRLRPDFAEAYNDLGNAWQHLGGWDKAVQCLREAVRLQPSLGPAYNSLGNALRAQGKLAAASEAFQQALRLQPNNPEIAYRLGVTLHEQGELDQAVECYRQVLRLNRANADVMNSLGTAFKEQGLLDEAIAQFRETLKLQPNHALAFYNLSKFVAEGRYRFAADELDRIKACMASGNCAAADRSQFGFGLATVLHKQGSYDEAFAYFKEANDLRKRILEERNVSFDAQGHEALIDRVIATYDRAYFEGVRGWGTDTDLPIFIVGMPRSGSTLVEQIISSHPQVFGAGELGEVPLYIARFVVEANPNLYTTPVLPSRGAARDLATDYLKRMANLGKGAARVTIKTLQNYMHLGVIASLFPRARVIHCRRDPFDVCLSCYFQNFQNIDFASSLEDIGVHYRAYEKLMAHWSRVLPLEIHEVANEDLIHDQETVTRKLIFYCGLEWDERCLTFFNTRRAVQTASSVQVRKPISGQAIGRWKHYRAHLGPLFKALGRSG
jgi:tetratricopeptide (TPR) repeat protein